MLRFYWLRDVNKHPVAVIASELIDGGHTLKYSVAVHNPKDKFNKQRGRAIAEARLQKGPFHMLHMNEHAKAQVMATIAEDMYPVRVREAAEAWYQRWRGKVLEGSEDTHADEIADARRGHP